MKKAFTLIELLVVIAIIAILAGIALPVFTRVQERGRATQDANNLRQIGFALAAYMNDQDDQFFSTGAGGGGAAASSWPTSLYDRYVQTTRVFQSPFDRRQSTDATPFPVSYGTNPNVMDKNASDFKSPSQLIIMAPHLAGAPDETGSWAGASDNNPQLKYPPPSEANGTHSARKNINALFGDSHVENLTWQRFSDNTTDAGKLRWLPEGISPKP